MGKALVGLAMYFCCVTVLADCNDDANAARQERRLDDAQAILNDCVSEEMGRLARSYLLLGLTEYDKGAHKKAIKQYTLALETAPEYVTALTNRGLSYAMSGNSQAAFEDFEKALDLDPQYMRAYFYRALTHAKDRDYGKSVRDYDIALQLASTDDDRKHILHNRGIAYRDAEQFTEALNDFNAAIEIDGSYADAFFSRAIAYQREDQVEAAMADYTRVIELDPDNAPAHYNRGRLHQSSRNHDLAARDYGKAVEIEPGYGRAHVNRGYVYVLPLLPLLLVFLLGV